MAHSSTVAHAAKNVTSVEKNAGSAPWEQVRAAENYREFLQAYLKERELSYSDLARAAGFARGFPSDVISGKRRLTARSCHAFEKALKLPPSGRKLFRFLVARDEPDVFPELDRDRVLTTIEALRAKPWNRAHREVQDCEAPHARRALQDPRAIAVYAAAGSPGAGASLDELRSRTRLSDDELKTSISDLIKAGLLKHYEATDQYEPQDLHVFFKANEKSEMFATLFSRAARATAERVRFAANSENELFFTSTFCVNESRLPELKAALRETILKFVDDAIHPEGDRIVQLVSSLHL